MLATFGLERLEAGLENDTLTASDVAEFLKQAEPIDMRTLAREGMPEALDGLLTTGFVASVVNPLTPQGASALSPNQSTGYLSVTTSVNPGSLSTSQAQQIIDGAIRRRRPD